MTLSRIMSTILFSTVDDEPNARRHVPATLSNADYQQLYGAYTMVVNVDSKELDQIRLGYPNQGVFQFTTLFNAPVLDGSRYLVHVSVPEPSDHVEVSTRHFQTKTLFFSRKVEAVTGIEDGHNSARYLQSDNFINAVVDDYQKDLTSSTTYNPREVFLHWVLFNKSNPPSTLSNKIKEIDHYSSVYTFTESLLTIGDKFDNIRTHRRVNRFRTRLSTSYVE